MSVAPESFALPAPAELTQWLERALDALKARGATQAEASVSVSRGLTVNVRMGEVESVEFQRDRGLSLTVYFGQQFGSASTGDFSARGLADAVEAACAIARASQPDPCAGLADAQRMARHFPDLDLYHPWAIAPDEAIERARACEAAAFATDKRITQSEGASLDTRQGLSFYANSHGFVGERRGSDHQLSCAVVAQDDSGMQRDYWYTAARAAAELEDGAGVGRRAAQRAVARLAARKLATRRVPVLYPAELARGLFGHFIGAISGGALYRRASFLVDQAGQRVFAPGLRLTQQPFLPRAAASAAFDQEGVATAERTLVDDGVLQGYLLGSYAARKLKLESTGNAGGVFNLVVNHGDQDFDALVADMGEGLVLAELLGQGVNTVTGDYSRGAAGFWVENGRIAYPVEEVTIAGNLRDMFRAIRAIGRDVDTRGNVRTGSVLVDGMMVAGH
jgi:PmbA protein